jgi:hypothetical protein
MLPCRKIMPPPTDIPGTVSIASRVTRVIEAPESGATVRENLNMIFSMASSRRLSSYFPLVGGVEREGGESPLGQPPRTGRPPAP